MVAKLEKASDPMFLFYNFILNLLLRLFYILSSMSSPALTFLPSLPPREKKIIGSTVENERNSKVMAAPLKGTSRGEHCHYLYPLDKDRT